jgi:hypothetical protein
MPFIVLSCLRFQLWKEWYNLQKQPRTFYKIVFKYLFQNCLYFTVLCRLYYPPCYPEKIAILNTTFPTALATCTPFDKSVLIVLCIHEYRLEVGHFDNLEIGSSQCTQCGMQIITWLKSDYFIWKKYATCIFQFYAGYYLLCSVWKSERQKFS